ncbi:MAG: element excision factor XisH family protein [Caldilineaceae bacterium]
MAKDVIHDYVKEALINDGWTITAEHFTVRYEELTIYPDLAAERALAAQRGERKIAVEVKSFLGRSTTTEVKDAVGQYVIYQTYLEEVEPERKVYLAISSQTYHDTFRLKAVQRLVERFSIMLIVVDIDQKEIVGWIE